MLFEPDGGRSTATASPTHTGPSTGQYPRGSSSQTASRYIPTYLLDGKLVQEFLLQQLKLPSRDLRIAVRGVDIYCPLPVPLPPGDTPPPLPPIDDTSASFVPCKRAEPQSEQLALHIHGQVCTYYLCSTYLERVVGMSTRVHLPYPALFGSTCIAIPWEWKIAHPTTIRALRLDTDL
jgi:hypothetical protein